VIVSGLLVGYLSSRPRFIGYWDTTAQRLNTLHPHTQQVLQDLGDSTLEVTFYTNIMDQISSTYPPLMYSIYPGNVNSYLDLWEPYLRYKPDIQFRYVYYFAPNPGDSSYWRKEFPGKSLRQIMGLLARMMQQDSTLFLSSEEMHQRINLEPEDYATIIQLKYKGRTTFLRMLPSSTGIIEGMERGNTEPGFSAAFSRLLGKKMPRVAFVSGELERSIYKKGEREYENHTTKRISNGSLINIGFDVDTLNLQGQDIPAGVSVLVLADPKMELSPVVQEKIRAYIEQGGNMLIMGEPGKQYVLNPILRQLGVQLLPGQLVQPSVNETPDKVKEYYTLPSYDLADEHSLLVHRHLVENHVVDSAGMDMPGVTGIQFAKDSGFTMKPLLLTDSNRSWQRVGKLVIDSTAPVFDLRGGDQNGMSFRTAVQLSRRINGKEQRIVVAGDADFAGNSRSRSEYVRSIYSWLCDNAFPVYTPFPYPRDKQVILSVSWVKGQTIVYIWILPALLLVLGTTLLVRRQRK
jgi:ABC-2 type transport system permease protein